MVFSLPENINLNIDLGINSLNWNNHSFTDIDGKLLLTGRKVSIQKINLKTLGGSVNGWIALDNKLKNGNFIEGKFKFEQIDITELFAEWENFDQTEITDKNLSGKAKGDIDILLAFNPYFSIIEDQIYVKTNLTISNGVLKGLETMKSITEYMRSNKGLKVLLNKHIDKFEEKLQNISFNTLTNIIEIKNRRINIPKMVISSSALDVGLFGWHDFDNFIDYHFNFRFRELKTKPEYTEYGKIEDDGLGIVIYLSMAGHLDDPVYGLDKEERINVFKENISNEKQDFKSMMKTEFGLFKKDSSVQRVIENNKKEVEFIYYEEDIEEKDTLQKKENVKRSNKFFNKLKKKQNEENKQEVDVIIDD